ATPLVPERRLKSGIPLGRITESGLYGPYATGATDGTETFAGFLATETAYNPASTRCGAALLVHGHVDPTKLPVPFDPAAVTTTTAHIIYKA
ncbi:MAG TPA: head decoration protein, partial [Streptomyces sp.]|nr:head decoration protein [Streptomyces sp.]